MQSGITTGEGESKNRHLSHAIASISQNWLPPTTTVLEKVQRGLREGAYELDTTFLLDDIRSDIGLYSFCLREVAKMIKGGTIKLLTQCEPTQMLRIAGFDNLRRIVNTPKEQISKFRIIDALPFQTSRLRDSIVSATTAEVLCEPLELDPELGFSVGLLRNLGLALLSWNYPNVYRRASQSLQEGTDFDTSFTTAAGFSPKMLVRALLTNWPLHDELAMLACSDPSFHSPIKSSSKYAHLKEICKVAESLARAVDPDNQNGSKEDWDFAQQEIHRRLGNGGMSQLREKIEVNLEAYKKDLPRDKIDAFDLRTAPSANKSMVFIKENPFIKLCSSPLKDELTALYKRLSNSDVSKENLRHLIKVIIPKAGYIRGCIYLFDPLSGMLAPHLKIGDSINTKLLPLPATKTIGESNPITVAFNCATPIVESGETIDGISLSVIAGCIGAERKVGVFYVEVNQKATNKDDSAPLIVFKALRQALNDCLNLS